MAITQPKVTQLNTEISEFTDPIIELNSALTGALTEDIGIVFNRGSSGNNVGIIWDQSAGHFALVENSCLIKTDFLGNKEWQLNIEGTEFHDGKILSSVQQTSDGGYVVAGINGNSWVDGLLIKVDLFENQNPSAPTIKGPTQGIPFLPRRYTAVSSDPDGDLLSFWFDWGDGQYTRWTEPFGVSASRFHLWEDSGTYSIRVKAMDEYGAQSDWSTFEVSIPRIRVWHGFLDMFPILERILGLLR